MAEVSLSDARLRVFTGPLADSADAAAGVLPAILAADKAHYNAAGAKGILTLIGRHMTRHGWTRKDA